MVRQQQGSSTRQARRAVVRRWQDPRLLAGVVLVLGAATVGTRVMAQADDTVAYWSVAGPVQAGEQVERDDLVATRVHLGSVPGDAYVRVTDELPAELADLRWTADLPEGSLVGQQAWSGASESRGHLPVSVQAGFLPSDLATGDVVDVWVGPGPGELAQAEEPEGAVLVASGLRVVDPGETDALAGSVTRTVLLDVGRSPVTGVQVGALAAGHVTLVRVP